MINTLNQAKETPWKAVDELLMYLRIPFAVFYVKVINGVKIKKNFKFYGLPKIMRHQGSSIAIGQNFENRNTTFSNPLGVNHATILCTWSKNATIEIGNDVGISGGSIVAATRITIGDGTIIGTNCTIIDTDFHPIKSANRRYSKDGIKCLPVTIGKNVFIGMNTTILKGATIPDNAVIPAGSVVHRRKTLNEN